MTRLTMTRLTKPSIARLAAGRGAACFLIAATALGLAGCSSMRTAFNQEAREGNPAPCPNVIVLQDAGRMVSFSGEEALNNVAYTAEIVNVQSACRYYGDEPIAAEVTVDFALGRGPQAEGDRARFDYFVAVTRTDRDLIAKEQFTVPVNFAGRDTARVREKVGRITIPRRDDSISGINFEIIVGLALTREQVIYNRSGKSLKFPELE